MTMISIATHPDRVEIVTDTLIVPNDTNLPHVIGRNGKVERLPTLTAAVTSTGNLRRGKQWRQYAARLAAAVDTFDEFVRSVDVHRMPGSDEYVLYAAGWSHRHRAFRVYAWASWRSEAMDVSGWHVQPNPDGIVRNDDLELSQIDDCITSGRLPADHPIRMGTVQRPTPTTPEEWAVLFKAIRRTRASGPYLAKRGRIAEHRVLGGLITRFRLTADGAESRDVVGILDDPAAPASADLVSMLEVHHLVQSHDGTSPPFGPAMTAFLQTQGTVVRGLSIRTGAEMNRDASAARLARSSGASGTST